jgi:hypothetical protein
VYHVYKLNEEEKKMTATVLDKIKSGAYNPTLPHPNRHAFTLIYVYHKGTVIENGVAASAVTNEMRDAWKKAGYVVDTAIDEVGMKAARDAYRSQNSELIDQFQKDLEEENGMVGHPKADAVFNKARSDRPNFQEQADEYEALVELVK